MSGSGAEAGGEWARRAAEEAYADVSPSDVKKREGKWAAAKIGPGAGSELKELIRGGVPHAQRRQLWLELTGGRALLEQRPAVYESARTSTFHHETPAASPRGARGGASAPPPTFTDSGAPRTPRLEDHQVPTFGGGLRDAEFPLSEDGRAAVRRILAIIAYMRPEINFLPMLPDLVCILHLYMSETEAYAAIAALLDALPRLPEQQRHFQITAPTAALAIETCVELIRSNAGSSVKHLEGLGLDLGKVVQVWFGRIFLESVPLGAALRIVDAYLSEGFKILYRVAIAIFKMHKDEIVKTTSADRAFDFLAGRLPCGRTPEALLKKAFGVWLSRSEADAVWNSNAGRAQELADRRAVSPMPSFFRPKILGDTRQAILQPDKDQDYPLVEVLWGWLPERQRHCNGRFIYCSGRDGLAGATFRERAKGVSPVVLLIRTTGGATLGAYSTAPLYPETDRYVGTGETFVFRIQPAPAIKYGAVVAAESRPVFASGPAALPPRLIGDPARRGSAPGPPPAIAVEAPSTPAHYHAARRSLDGPPLAPGPREPPAARNEQYVWPTANGILFGSGGAGYALQLSADLTEGSTAACPTFDSDALVSDDGRPGGGGGRRSAELPRRPGGGGWDGPEAPALGRAASQAATHGHFHVAAVDLLQLERP